MDKDNNNNNSNGRKLTNKQKMFINEYLVDFNATKAAERAGYKKSVANNIGCRNLRKPHIKERVDILVQELLDNRLELGAKTIRELEAICRSDVTDFIVIGSNKKVTEIRDLNEADTRAIASMEVIEDVQRDKNGKVTNVSNRKVKLRLWDKTRSLETLSKVANLQSNEMTVKGTLNLKVDLISWKNKVKEKLLKDEDE